MASSTDVDKQQDTRKTVLITGCSPGGIGHALALQFHSQNYHVFATARNPNSLTTLSSLPGITCLPLTVDSDASILDCLSLVQAHLPPTRGLDYLVHNAGIAYYTPALDIQVSEVRQTFETNVIGVMRITQIFSPLLIQSQGTIVMISSVTGILPLPFSSVYNASKAALKSYADTLRLELKPLGVDVITVITGGVTSNISKNNSRGLPPGSLYAPVAHEVRMRQVWSQTDTMPTMDFARNVVEQVTKGEKEEERKKGWKKLFLWLICLLWPWRTRRNRWIWQGAKVGLVYWIGGGYSWNGWIVDRVLSRKFKLSELNFGIENAKKVD